MMSKSALLLAGLLLVLAAVPRLYGLDTPGFYGDEETTAFAAAAVAAGDEAAMPSGMPYRRALPLTWLNALTANAFGPEREIGYRVPAAILGVLTVPLLYLLLAGLVGHRIAFVTALLLAFSEWHVLTSREARMYAPFVLFFSVAAFSFMHWFRSQRWTTLATGLAAYFVAVTLHTLAAFAVLFLLVPLVVRRESRVTQTTALVTAAFAALVSAGYYLLVESTGYAEQGALTSTMTLQRSGPVDDWLALLGAATPLEIAALLAGVGLGVWGGIGAWRTTEAGDAWLRRLALTALVFGAGVAAGVGQAYAFGLCCALYALVLGQPFLDAARRLVLPAIVMLLALVAWSAYRLLTEDGVVAAAKSVLSFPYFYPALFLDAIPGVAVLVAAACAWQCWKPSSTDGHGAALREAAVIVLLIVAAMGIVSRWGGMRYFAQAYVLFALLAAAALLAVCDWLAQRIGVRRAPATVAACAVVCVGVLGAHGMPQAWAAATVDYGDPTNETLFGFAMYPDHRTTGLFVKERARADDIIVAEDVLEQRWYAGRVDYWLHDADEAIAFLYRDSNGLLRDIYTSSIVLNDELLAGVAGEQQRRVWIITSAETAESRGLYLSDRQRQWLDAVTESTEPAAVGHDGVSAAYCLRCELRHDDSR